MITILIWYGIGIFVTAIILTIAGTLMFEDFGKEIEDGAAQAGIVISIAWPIFAVLGALAAVTILPLYLVYRATLAMKNRYKKDKKEAK